MNDFNHNGRFDDEDYLIMEEDDKNIDDNANTTLPFIVVTLVIIGILAALKLL